MVVPVGFRSLRPPFMASLRDVYFAADHWMDAVVVCLTVEFHRAEEIAVIGHRDSRHFLVFCECHQLFDVAGAVKQGVVGMAVEVNERAFGHAD